MLFNVELNFSPQLHIGLNDPPKSCKRKKKPMHISRSLDCSFLSDYARTGHKTSEKV